MDIKSNKKRPQQRTTMRKFGKVHIEPLNKYFKKFFEKKIKINHFSIMSRLCFVAYIYRNYLMLIK